MWPALTCEFYSRAPDHLPAAAEEGEGVCVQDPQNFLVFLGLEEKGIAKRGTRKGPFTKKQHPRSPKEEALKDSETHKAIDYSLSCSNLN